MAIVSRAGHRVWRWRSTLGASVAGVSVCFFAPASALTITLNFDSVQSDAPAFDPSAAQLQSTMQAAADHWERIFALGHDLTINFWYDDLAGTPLADNADLTFSGSRITEANIRFDTQEPGGAPRLWYFDPTPTDDSEYVMRQTLYEDLSSADQTDFFNGSPPDRLEAGYWGPADLQSSSTVRNGFDALSVALHEVGHSLGVPAADPANTEADDGDYDFKPGFIGGATAAVRNAGLFNFDTAHLDNDFALMTNTISAGRRVRPSATDVLAMDTTANWSILNLFRKEFIGPSINYNDNGSWVGALEPLNGDDVYVRHGGLAVLTAPGFAGNLFVSETDTKIITAQRTLRVFGDTHISDGGIVNPNAIPSAGLFHTDTLTIGKTGTGELLMEGGNAQIDTAATTFPGGEIEGYGTVTLGGGATLLNGGVIRAAGNNQTLKITGGSVVLDGFAGAGGNGDLFVGNGSDNVVLDIESTIADEFSGDLTVTTNGTLRIDDPWTVNTSGDLFLFGGTIEGGKLDFNGILELSGSSRINMPVDFNQFARVVFRNLSSELELFGTTDYVGWNSINPTFGTLRQTGDAFFSNPLTLGLNRYDMDGRNENSFINVGGDVVLNVNQLDLADNVFNGNLEISEPGKLTVNTPAPWELAGTGAFIGSFVGPAAVVLDGSRVIISGSVEADGNSQTDAPVTITGTVEFPNLGGNRGLVLNGAGGNLITAGQVIGPGTLGATPGTTLTGHGNISSDVDFAAGSELLAQDGTLNLTGDVAAGVLGTGNAAGVLNLTQPLQPGDVDELRLNGGSITGSDISHDGTTTGDGQIDVVDFVTSGDVSPGSSAGSLEFSGDYAQTAASRLVIEIGGPGAGITHDEIQAANDADLDGELALSLINGFDPQPYVQSFSVLTAGQLLGTFDTVTGFLLPGGHALAVTYSFDTVTVTRALFGDADLSRQVEQADLDAVLQNWGSTTATWATGDLNGNGQVEQGDLDAVLQNWGDTAAPDFGGSDLPEPGTIAGLFLLLAGVGRRAERV